MQVLAVDTATPVTTIALAQEDKLLAEAFYNTRKTHSERLMPEVNNMLQETGINLKDLDGFAVSIGPGSFTGLRIGLATVKGFCHVLQKPLIGISTLDALACNVEGREGLICPILNARKNEVYTAIYRGREMERLTDYMAVSPQKLVEILSEYNAEEVTVLGDGVAVYKDFLLQSLQKKLCLVSFANNSLRASQTAFLGIREFQKGNQDSVMTLKPQYIRKSEAQVRLEEKRGKE